jgi:CRISPR type I-E-associated protein CasB/Cse2
MNTFRLIDSLARAAERGDGAVLGALRRGWTQPLALYPVISPFLPVPASKHVEDVSMLVACLFGEYPKRGSTPLAAALRRVAERRGGNASEARFTALLVAPRSELPTHLRRAVTLAKGEDIAIDWHRLFDDLLRWEDYATRRQWAREYWAPTTATTEPTEPTEPTKETT